MLRLKKQVMHISSQKLFSILKFSCLLHPNQMPPSFCTFFQQENDFTKLCLKESSSLTALQDTHRWSFFLVRTIILLSWLFHASPSWSSSQSFSYGFFKFWFRFTVFDMTYILIIFWWWSFSFYCLKVGRTRC